MAFATDIIRGANSGSLRDRFTSLRADLGERYATWKVYRDTLNELSSLSDRDLADLGVARSSIRSIAMEAAHTR